MKKLFVLFLLPILLISYPKYVHADFYKSKIAVLDFMLQGKGFETDDLGQIVAEWLITALVKDGRFDVVERRLLKKIIAEQQLSDSGLLDQGTTAQLGKVLGVKVIISGSVMRIQDATEVNSRIIDVETGSILAAESVKNDDASQLKNLVEQMAKKIIRAFPLEGYIVNRKQEHVTIDLGRNSGVKPGMKFIVYKEGKVIKHPKTGEVLDVQKNQTGYINIIKVFDKLAEGQIKNETEPKAIQYGQLVKSASREVAKQNRNKKSKPERRSKDIKVRKSALFVDVVPKSAVVKILNIKPKYHRGIELSPGKYLILATAPDHQPKSKWIKILPGEKKHISIELIRSMTEGKTNRRNNKTKQMETQIKPSANKPDTEKILERSLDNTPAKTTLTLAVFPWQLVDEHHWGSDLSRDKLIQALFDTANQNDHVSLKYSFYQCAKSSGVKTEPILNKIKIAGERGVWKGRGLSITPNTNNVLQYGKKINADFVLMGNLLFSDIDGQPGSGKYELYLYLVDLNTGNIEKSRGYFTEHNSIKKIKNMTRKLLKKIPND